MTEVPNATSKVFVSYSRRNKEFAKKLNDSLDSNGVDAWVDWEGIPLSSDWMDEITRAIEGADAFLFIITPDSLASKVCYDELELGLKYNKKLIPILHIEPNKDSTMHDELGATNWVYMREEDDYDATLPALINTIHTDLGWVRKHTRLLERAKEWEDEKKNNSFLLRGSDLDTAEGWMVGAAEQEGREVVPLQGEYIQASRIHATQKQRNLLIGVSLALVVSVGLAIFAMFQRSVAVEQTEVAMTQQAVAEANEQARATQQVIAEENEKEAVQNAILAQAQRAAAEARIYQSLAGELDTSSLLAIDSWLRSPSLLAEDILRRNTSLSPMPIAQVSQGGQIWRIKDSPDGIFFATASDDGTVCLWDVMEVNQKFCVEHYDAVYDLLFSLDGEILITAGADSFVNLWNANDGTPIRSYEFSGTTIWDLDLRPDGTQVAVAREDGFISLINLTDFEESPTDRDQGSAVYKVVYSPDNDWLGVGTASGESYFWNLDDVYAVLGAQHSGEIYALDFSADSQFMVTGGSDSIARLQEVNEEGHEIAQMGHGDWIEFIDFSSNGEWFATASDDNNLRIWDVETATEKLRMAHDGYVMRMDISDNGAWISSTGYDETARVWDTVSGSEIMHIPLDNRGTAILFNDDNTRLFVGTKDGTISLWDTSALNARLNTIEYPELVREAHFSPDAKWMAVNTDAWDAWLMPVEDTLSIKKGTDGVEIINTEGLSYDLVFSPNAEWLALAVTREHQVVLYNINSKKTETLEFPAKTYAIDFSPDNSQLAIGGGDGILHFYDLASEKEIDSIENPSAVQSVAYYPEGKQIAVGMEAQIIVWDTESETQVATLSQTGSLHNIAYSHDGLWLATASSNGEIYLWDVKDGYTQSPKILHINGSPYSLEFSPNNNLLAGGSSSKFAYLWDISLGQEVARIPHNDLVSSVSFSPDGAELATVSRKTVQIWDVAALPTISTSKLVDAVCAHLIANLSEARWASIYPDEEYRPLCPDLAVKE